VYYIQVRDRVQSNLEASAVAVVVKGIGRMQFVEPSGVAGTEGSGIWGSDMGAFVVNAEQLSV
jgi:hypothetical protein